MVGGGFLMDLYQWGGAYQRHYVVADSYADAERTILEKYGGSGPDELVCLGPYVQVSRDVLERLYRESRDDD